MTRWIDLSPRSHQVPIWCPNSIGAIGSSNCLRFDVCGPGSIRPPWGFNLLCPGIADRLSRCRRPACFRRSRDLRQTKAPLSNHLPAITSVSNGVPLAGRWEAMLRIFTLGKGVPGNTLKYKTLEDQARNVDPYMPAFFLCAIRAVR